ncbi:nucleotidyltransferase domain-containing protein [Aquisalimonas lutea]|uniref:type VII toxin-antitoxin system MntA family adenylyltransferase antitoxin n=1 Tax=Aquisalimonas lutea TaxID=1327750 RepID=UPI0025B3B11E|nr:nucleotidyltransferase domain-containing protein [Aquisalimonas lutea]MDN3517812.1 nucleotidyltransferase domain-containing protein [Aquisalimonas lutea]
MDNDALTTRIQAILEAHADEIACAYLFGSRATGTERPDSDIDLAVLFRDAQPRRLMGPAVALRGELEEHTGYEVELIDLEAAPVDLVHRVLREGRLLLDPDPGRRIAFEVDARNRYFDLLPYIQAYRRAGSA